MKKLLPPYGEYLANQLSISDEYQIAIVFIGNSGQQRAENFQSHLPYALYLPPFNSPFKYIWPLNNCEVYLIDTEYASLSFIRSCAVCFLGYGAKIIQYINKNRSLIIEKGVSHE